jgi:hypothetical protein
VHDRGVEDEHEAGLEVEPEPRDAVRQGVSRMTCGRGSKRRNRHILLANVRAETAMEVRDDLLKDALLEQCAR